jgi:RNA polymerase sigma factor (sigma-70 family)
MPQVTDAELVGLVQDRGPDATVAWRTLVARHSPRLYAVGRCFALDPATAEDLVQTAWLRLLEHLGDLRDASSVGPWLCMVVRNEARKLVTRRRTIPAALDLDQTPAQIDPPETRLVTRERAAALRTAFSRLGQDCQQLLRLLSADPPLSYDEIAVALDRPRGALGPTRRRCLDQLRGHMPAGFA